YSAIHGFKIKPKIGSRKNGCLIKQVYDALQTVRLKIKKIPTPLPAISCGNRHRWPAIDLHDKTKYSLYELLLNS
ncbi:MAG: hypothetical protein ACKOQ2_10910, partial [Dolichospermum sp.]